MAILREIFMRSLDNWAKRDSQRTVLKKFIKTKPDIYLYGFNCPHCKEFIYYKSIDITCPQCKTDYIGLDEFAYITNVSGTDYHIILPATIKILFFGCTKCSNKVQFIECPHCEQMIDLHSYKRVIIKEEPKFSPFEYQINKNVREMERQAELEKLNHQQAVGNILYNNLSSQMELKAKEIQNLKLMSEVNMNNAKNKQEFAKSELMYKAVNNFDALPQSLQVYVMRAVFNPGDKQDDDILLQEQVREYLKMEKEAAAEKSKQEARKMKAQADVEEATADDSIRKMKKQQ